jgi:hypothetical protein
MQVPILAENHSKRTTTYTYTSINHQVTSRSSFYYLTNLYRCRIQIEASVMQGVVMVLMWVLVWLAVVVAEVVARDNLDMSK